MAKMTINVDVAPIKSCITSAISDFEVMIKEQQNENEAIYEEFKELKEIVLDMYKVVSYMAEHWER